MSKLESRFREADRIPVSDRWPEITGREPGPQKADPGPVRRLVVVAFAFAIGVAAVALAVTALRTDGSSGPATSPTVTPGPALTGEPRITAKVPLPEGHIASGLGVGAGSVWVGISPMQGSSPCHVLRIDLSTNEVVAEIPFSNFPGPMAATDNAVWVGSYGALDRIDPSTNLVVGSLPLPDRAVSAIAADESAVWVVTVPASGPYADEGVLVRVDPVTTTIAAEIPLGDQVVGYHDEVRIGAGGVWVLGVRWFESEDAEYGSDLIRVDPATNTIVARVPVGGFRMVVGDDEVWVRFPADGVFDARYQGGRGERWLWTRVNVDTNEPSDAFDFADSGLELVTPQALWSIGNAEYDEQQNVRVTRFDPETLDVVATSKAIAPVFTGAVIDQASGTVWITTVTDVVRVDIS